MFLEGESKFPKKSEEHKKTTNLDKRISSILCELKIMNPETLLLEVDPSVHSVELIQQIQMYHALKSYEADEKEVQNNLKQKKIQYEKLLKSNQNEENPLGGKSSSNRKKPTIDYRIKIKGLENDLNNTYQKFNRTKTYNEELKAQLNELRKSTIINQSRLEESTKNLDKERDDYKTQKKKIELNIKNEEREKASQLDKIKIAQEILLKNSGQLADGIQSYDHLMTQKLAEKKFLENEAKNLEKERQRIETKWNTERKRFYEENAEVIRQTQSFDKSSQVLEVLNEEKLNQLKLMLERIYHETGQHSIEELVNYFIECTKEYKNFEKHMTEVSSYLENLEKEVNDLDYIINFLHQTNPEKEENKLIIKSQEEKISQYEIIKRSGEELVHLQFHIINELYKKYTNEISTIMMTFHPETETDYKELDFLNFSKLNFQLLQEKLKSISEIMTSKHFINKPSIKHSNTNLLEIPLENTKINLHYDEIQDRVRDTVKNKIDSKGRLVAFEDIKSSVDNMLKDK